MNLDPKSYNYPEGKLLGDDQIDDIARALLHITREICVLNDRQMITEAILTEHNIDISEAIDTHQPDEALQAKIDARTGEITRNIIEALQGR